jgi:hypothetical protein
MKATILDTHGMMMMMMMIFFRQKMIPRGGSLILLAFCLFSVLLLIYLIHFSTFSLEQVQSSNSNSVLML